MREHKALPLVRHITYPSGAVVIDDPILLRELEEGRTFTLAAAIEDFGTPDARVIQLTLTPIAATRVVDVMIKPKIGNFITGTTDQGLTMSMGLDSGEAEGV